MSGIDPQVVHQQTIEYYRLVMKSHENNSKMIETTEADRAILEMVKVTPGLMDMNREMTEGGLTFNLTRAIAVDGYNYQADIHKELEEESLAATWRERANIAAATNDYAALDANVEKHMTDNSQIEINESRLKIILADVIEKLMLADASPPNTGYDESEITVLNAFLSELKELLPGQHFPDLFKIPRLRKRLVYSDELLVKLEALFEKVNTERLGGAF